MVQRGPRRPAVCRLAGALTCVPSKRGAWFLPRSQPLCRAMGLLQGGWVLGWNVRACACVRAEGGRKGGKRKSQGSERCMSHVLRPALSCWCSPHLLVSKLWPEPSSLGSQGSLGSRSVSQFPLSPTGEWLPGAQAACQEHSERHQLAVTLPQTPQMEFLRSAAGLCVGASEMHGFGFVNTGLLNLGWALGLGEHRSIFWQLLNSLSGFETLLIPYIVGGLF